LGGVFDIASKNARAAELDELTAGNEFWSDQEKAQAILKDAVPTEVILSGKNISEYRRRPDT
jgi:hypothetical protein